MRKQLVAQALCGIAILGLATLYVYRLTLVPWTSVFAGILAGFVIVAVTVVSLLLRKHPGCPGNPWWLPAGFLGGVGISVAIAPANTAYLQAAASLPEAVMSLFSSFPEETAKLLAVFALIAALVPIRRPIEAAVVGMAVGAGFTVAEVVNNSLIAASMDLQSDYFNGVGTMTALFVLGPFSHAVYTGLAAWGLGIFLCHTDQPLDWRLAHFAVWFLLATALHGTFNASRVIPGIAGLIAMITVTVVEWMLLIWLYRRSRAIGRRDAAAQVSPGK